MPYPDLLAIAGLDYPAILGAVLAANGVVDPQKWATCSFDSGEAPALCRMGEGMWALELWHDALLGAGVIGQTYVDSYRESYGQTSAADVLLYVAALTAAYGDMVAEGLVAQGAPINVCVSCKHPAFAAACIAQKEGLPIYTVVGEDDGTLAAAKRGAPLPPRWQVLAPYAAKGFAKAFPDVLEGNVSAEEAADAILEVLEDSGYLLSPTSARAARLAAIYREEAESRNPMVVVIGHHPYLEAMTLAQVLTDETPKDEYKAMRLCELESGWEIPAALLNPQKAAEIRKILQNGERL